MRRARRLAAPFIVSITTAGAAAGCAPSRAVTPTNPPPVEPPIAGESGTRETHAASWRITRYDNGTCVSMMDIECPPAASCNPPPPTPYTCPDLAGDLTGYVIQRAEGATECYAIPPMGTCPEGAACNPPPPQPVACPTP